MIVSSRSYLMGLPHTQSPVESLYVAESMFLW